MNRRLLAVAVCLIPISGGLHACRSTPGWPASPPAATTLPDVSASDLPARQLAADLNRLLDTPILARALVGIKIVSLTDGRVVFERNAGARVIPASVMKILTMTTAASTLGWDYRFETRLDAIGPSDKGILDGDLVVVGGGDPSIAAQDLRDAGLFDEWARALHLAGISRVRGRIIGDDSAFEHEPLGAGWAWDYLSAGYAAPSSALSYNENVVVLRITPGATPGSGVRVDMGPPGHGLIIDNQVTTGTKTDSASVAITRAPGTSVVTVTGRLPAGSASVVRTTTVDDPTRFFVEGLRLALASRGIVVDGGAVRLDASTVPASNATRRIVARHQSAPLSSLVGYGMKVSQNFYGEMLLKAVGRGGDGKAGSTERGREAVQARLKAWDIPTDALVMYDGSGLSRYNYVSAELITSVLERAWHDTTLRGPFIASLPVGGHDGTLELRMRGTTLDRRVQAKTGTIANVRSLAGYVEPSAGGKLAFAIIANHFTAPNAQVDAVMEQVLARVVEGAN